MINFLREKFRILKMVSKEINQSSEPQQNQYKSGFTPTNVEQIMYAEKNTSPFEKVMLLANNTNNSGRETLIRALIRPIQSDYLLAVATEGQDARECFDGRTFFFSSFIYYFDHDSHQKKAMFSDEYTVSLATDIVLPCPWSENRFKNALSIGSHAGKPWVSDDNHKIDLWLPWRIGFVSGGNHSLMSGILWGEGEVKAAKVTDASPVFDRISTDGFNWYVDEKVVENVKDYRVAAIFEIGRLLL